MAQLRLRLLGGFRADVGGRPVVLPKKSQALLAYLALSTDRSHSRTRLAGLLWGDRGEEQARNSLRQALFAIRHATRSARPGLLSMEGEGVKLSVGVLKTDVGAVRDLIAKGTREALEQMVILYEGELLEGFHVEDASWETWVGGERERLRQQVVKAMAALLGRQVREGARDDAIQTAIRLLTLDPLQESAHRALMRMYAEVGRRESALKQYEVCAEVLRRELSVAPEAETTRLYRNIVAQRAGGIVGTESGRGRARTDRRLDARTEMPVARTPMIGRDRELSLLEGGLRHSWEGHSRVLAVLGEAGIGKTRLLEELGVGASRRGGLVVQGRGYVSEQILPFGLWVEALRRIVVDGAAQAALAPAWRDELARLFPELRPRGGEPGPENYLRLFEAIGLLLTHLAAQQPVLVVLDDVHWADQTSVRLLPFLARRLDRQPVCLALTVRSEEAVDHPLLRSALTELDRDDRLIEVPLLPLSREHTLGLMRALGGSSADVEARGERVWQVSGGNPLAVVEVVRTLADGTVAPSADLTVPERVRRLVVDRLDRLSDGARATASVAAVIGRECDLDLLQQASELNAGEVVKGVEQLIVRHILREVDGHFEFTHDRVREVVYTSLSLARRHLSHAAVAEAIETLRAHDIEPHRGALVAHYKEAQDWAKAIHHLRAAARQAQTRGAYREALEMFDEVLGLLGRLPESVQTAQQGVDVRVQLRRTALAIGALRPPLRYLDEAERLARSAGDQRRLGIVLGEESYVYWLQGRYRDAIELGRRVVDIEAAFADPFLRGLAGYCVGKPYYALGDYRRAIEFLEPAAAMAEGWDHPASGLGSVSGSAGAWLACALARVGRFDDALHHARDAIADAEAGHGVAALTWATYALGAVLLDRGVLEEAIIAFERSSELAQTSGIRRHELWCKASLAYLYLLSNRTDDGLRCIDADADVPRPHGADALFRRGQALLAAGRVDEALVVGQAGLELAREMEERGTEAFLLRLLGDVRAKPGVRASVEAESFYRRALGLAGELGMRPLVAQCQLGLGRCARERDCTEARARIETAAATFRQLEMPLWLSRAEAALEEVAAGE